MLRWTTVPIAAGALVVALAERPPVLQSPFTLLDAALTLWLAAAAATLVPLPASARVALSPASPAIEAALFLDVSADPAASPPRPLSLDPVSTAWALAVAAALVLVFWSARAIVARGGLRATTRGIAWIGLAVSALAIVQRGTSPDRLYWWIRPAGLTPRPFGPFVNRNDMATWLIMAIPLVLGYAVTRVDSRRRAVDGGIDVERAFDSTALWLGAAIVFMLATLLVTTSRSGLMGEAAGLAAFVWLARRRLHHAGLGWMLAIFATAAAVAATYASWDALATRVEETLTIGLGGRREIWERTWAMATDFLRTGVGVGAYERAMSVYQRQPHVFYFNHAHNEYLQLLAEGGVLLAVPALAALAAGAWQAWHVIGSDRSPIFWVRAGAVSGMAAAGVQSMWETGLRIPANAVLFALLAAIALHPRRR